MPREPQTWVWYSEEDIKSAEVLLQGERYLQVYFHCQQAVEKRLKAVIVQKTGDLPPKIHDLPRLLTITGLDTEEAVQDFLTDLNELYIVTRYPLEPGFIESLCDKTRAEDVFEQTGEVVAWLDEQLALNS